MAHLEQAAKETIEHLGSSSSLIDALTHEVETLEADKIATEENLKAEITRYDDLVASKSAELQQAHAYLEQFKSELQTVCVMLFLLTHNVCKDTT
jgi:hypothetical protein